MLGPVPRSLMIGGLRHRVEVVDSGLLGDELLGECAYTIQRIRLLDAMPRQKTRQVLMHEILEAITSTHLLELNHEQLSVTTTELLRVLDDNPALRRYLWGGA